MTIDELNNNMTLFYSKRTGEIKAYCTGITDMGYFSADAEDYLIIWDYIVLPIDKDVLNKFSNYKVNTNTKQLEILPIIDKYPIAQ